MKSVQSTLTILLCIVHSLIAHSQTEINSNQILFDQGLGSIVLDELPHPPNLNITNSSSFFIVNPSDSLGGIQYNSLFHEFEVFDVRKARLDNHSLHLTDLEVRRTSSGFADLLPFAYATFKRVGGLSTTSNSTGNISFNHISGGVVEVSLPTNLIAADMVILATPITTDISLLTQCSLEYLGGTDDHKFRVHVRSIAGNTTSSYGLNLLIYNP